MPFRVCSSDNVESAASGGLSYLEAVSICQSDGLFAFPCERGPTHAYSKAELRDDRRRPGNRQGIGRQGNLRCAAIGVGRESTT